MNERSASARPLLRCRVAALTVLACLVTGCLEVKEHLTIRSDGSGTLVIEVHSAIAPASIRRRGWADLAKGSPDFLPPLTKEHAVRLFPGRGLRVEATEGSGGGGGPTMLVKVAFQDIQALVASPYGTAHGLWLHSEGGKLHFAANSGLLQTVVFSHSHKVEFFGKAAGHTHALKNRDQMSTEFTVTLPNAIAASNGKVEGRSATWRLERSKGKNEADLIRMLTGPLRAACPAAGIDFAAVSPPRLGLFPFGEVKEGPAPGMRVPPDPRAVVAAARFVPHMVKSVQSFYLPGRKAGEAERRTDEARARPLDSAAAYLVGVLELPRELVPDRWGEPRVDRAADDVGTDLKLGEDELRQFRSSINAWDRAVREELTKGPHDVARHVLELRTRAPGRDATRLARLNGAVELEYFGDYRIAKLPDAIPDEWIAWDTRHKRRPARREGRPVLASPLLRQLGLEVSVLHLARQSEPFAPQRLKTTIWLSARSEEAGLLDVQVFDADGVPWPRVAWGSDRTGPVDVQHFAVPGTPKPPLSLALLVHGTRLKVRVPIVLTAELRGLAFRGRLETGELRRRPRERKSYAARIPLTEAAPGFLVVPIAVTTVRYHLLRHHADLVRRNRHALRESRGVTIRAELTPPRDRYLISLERFRVTKAADDKGRKLSPRSDWTDLWEERRLGPVLGPALMTLRLDLPERDASTLARVEGEAIALTGSGWKKMTIANPKAAQGREIDLSAILPDTTMKIDRVSGHRWPKRHLPAGLINERWTVSLTLRGTETIHQLDFLLKFRGDDQPKRLVAWPAQVSSVPGMRLNIGHPFWCERVREEDRAPGEPSLIVRAPGTVRHERITFSLHNISLFKPPPMRTDF